MVSSEDTRLRVVIADDHARYRGVIRSALETSDCEVVAEAATAEDAVRACEEHRPDVALLDIHMPGSGVRAAHEITARQPEIVVVMLTASAEEEDLFDSLRAGATGYLLKDTDPATLASALRATLAGEAALTPRLLIRILDEFRAPTKARFRRGSRQGARLSSREWEVMTLLVEGASTDQVARRLFISRTTVRVHISSVLKKLRVSTRDEAITLLRDRSGD
jgi:DNA-binding NarL/FixJ family response regulator